MGNIKLQGYRAAEVTPDNDNPIFFVGSETETVSSCVLYVGIGGNVRVLTDGGDDVTFVNVQDGTWFPVQVTKVFATGTDAENIIAIW